MFVLRLKLTLKSFQLSSVMVSTIEFCFISYFLEDSKNVEGVKSKTEIKTK